MLFANAQAKKAFAIKMQLPTSSIEKEIRKHSLKACVLTFAIGTYEMWMIYKEIANRSIKNLVLLRRLKKVCYINRTTNTEVLNFIMKREEYGAS